MQGAALEPHDTGAHPNQFALLGQRRFGPFFWTQFLGAGNDNLFKFAFTVMVTYQLQVSWLPTELAGLAIGALFILPFLLFSATSGQLADKYDKSALIRFVKWLEIAIMLLAGWGFATANVPVLLACVFLMGLHSTLFGPVKFAYLPQHLSERELTGGNGMVEMGTFVAILLGSVAGGLLIAMPEVGARATAWACLGLALLGRAVAQAIPAVAVDRPGAAHQLEPVQRDLAQPEARARQRRRVPLAARHLVDVVLRRRLPVAVPVVREGGAARQRAGRVAAAGRVLDRHRRRLAALRGAVAPPCRDRPGAARRDRHERVLDRPLLRIARPAAGRQPHARRVHRPAAALARDGRPARCCRCSPGSTACRCTR